MLFLKSQFLIWLGEIRCSNRFCFGRTIGISTWIYHYKVSDTTRSNSLGKTVELFTTNNWPAAALRAYAAMTTSAAYGAVRDVTQVERK